MTTEHKAALPDALLPCPFCGGEARCDIGPKLEYPWYVCCDEDCAVQTDYFRNKDGAVNAWNRRAAPCVAPPTRRDEAMALHWIDRYAAGIDQEPQWDRIEDALGVAPCVAPEAVRAAAFERAMKESWEMVQPTPSPPGSYYLGMNNGMASALRTVRENYERALTAAPVNLEKVSEGFIGAAPEGRDAVMPEGWGPDDFYSGHPLPILHDDPAINAEILVGALCARLDAARQALADAAAMQVIEPKLQKIKANAAWAMCETDPRRVLPRTVKWNVAAAPASGEGYARIERNVVPVHVAEVGARTVELARQMGYDAQTTAMMAFTEMVLAADPPPREGGPASGEAQDDGCQSCKGSGEVEVLTPHASGDPQDGYMAPATCPACDGNGCADPWMPVSIVLPMTPGWYIGLNYGRAEPLRYDGTSWHHTRLTRDLAMPSHWRTFDSLATPADDAGKDADDVLRKVIRWAESRCPCHEETPDPCTLCGATVESGTCKAVESVFPRKLLAELRAALQSTDRQEGNGDG